MDNKIILNEKSIPGEWYNIIPDLPFDLPPAISPHTGYPIGPHDLSDLFPQPIIEQELDTKNRSIKIPDAVREIYRLWRPTPLFRAERFEKMLGTPARIYYKYEGVSPAGGHELNTAVAQAYYCKKENIKRLVTGTSAGEWGIALAMACKFFGINCRVYMARAGFEQTYGRVMMKIWNADVVPSPSNHTKPGQKALSEDQSNPGSLGLAISEAVWEAMNDRDTKYSLGTVMNHVVLHQTVIGLEAAKQMEQAKAQPDIIIGCVGGGSNFAGLSFPFMTDQLRKKTKIRFIAAEPIAAPSLTAGEYAYDHPDTNGLMPLLKMYTLGHDFVPVHIRAGAMRYHGMSPLVSALYDRKIIEAVAYPETAVLEAAIQFAHCEGIIPSPESAYAIKAVTEQALACKASNEKKTILFALNAHGYFGLDTYESFLAGQLKDAGPPIEQIRSSLTRLPQPGAPGPR